MARIGALNTLSVVILGVVGLGFHPAAVVAQARPRITVTVYNRSNMRNPILAAGEGVAQRVLSHAGVESMWVNCPVRNTAVADAECNQPRNPTRLILTVVPRWADRRVDPHSLGLALEVEHGFASYCYVFQERLDDLAAATHVSPALLLGHAMAHEIGHLLKGSGSHSPGGVMSDHWYANELRAAAMDTLNFTADDAALMKTRLAQAEDIK
jgi:hypothetical protein